MKMNTSCNDDGKLVPYSAFTNATPALPAFYWDVYSSEQRIKELCKELCKLVDYANELGIHINLNKDDIIKLQNELQNLKDGGLLDYYEKQIYQWIQDNMRDIMAAACKQVYFGLNDDGYFVAYVPDSWNEITFDTGAVFGRSDYGRLILRFDAEGNAINNTYSYSLSQTQSLKQLIADLEVNAKRTDSTFDTLFTNLDKEVAAPQGNQQQMSKSLVKVGDNV